MRRSIAGAWAVLVIAVAVAASACTSAPPRASGGTASAAAATVSLTGDAQTKALFARARVAYAHLQGVELSVVRRAGAAGPFGTLVVDLTSRVIVGEAWIPTGPGPELVARDGGPTYARDTSTSCWRALSPSDPRTLGRW